MTTETATPEEDAETNRPAAASGTVQQHIAEAEAALARQDTAAARKHLEAAFRLAPENADLALGLGHLEMAAENFPAALQAYTAAAANQPNLAPAYAGQALALQLLDRSAEAAPAAHRALTIDPSEIIALKVLARIHLNMHQPGIAAGLCRQILQRNSRDSEAFQMLEQALAREVKPVRSEPPPTQRPADGALPAPPSAPNILRLPDRINRIVERVRPYTMVPTVAVIKTIELTLEASDGNDEDIIAECGVWKGGSSLAMILAQKEILGCVRHPVWMFDSFEGLPKATPDDGPLGVEWEALPDHPSRINNCKTGSEEVLAMMNHEGIDPSHYRVFKGWFNQTLQPAAAELQQRNIQIALLRLDGDWYESTIDCLNWLFPRLRKGAPCILDDYYAWDGTALAVHEYFGRNRIAARIRSIQDWHGAYFYNKVRESFHEL
jgi:O-methyltransferase